MVLASLLVMGGAAALAPWLSHRLGRMTGYVLALLFLVSAGLLLVRAPEVLDGATVTESWMWVASFGVEFTLRLNGLSLLFAMLVLGVGALVLSYAPQYLDPDYEHGRLYGILGLFAAAMLGLVLAGDLILLLVFWEITTFCSFLLVGGNGLKGSRPALRALMVTAGGGIALLGAAVLLTVRTGTTQISAIIELAPEALSATDIAIVGPLIVIAAFTKSAQLPFHFWLPGAMVAITPVSAYLHAATLVKAGIYLLLLFSPLFTDVPGWHLSLMGVGLTTTVFGAYQALRQNDLKALLAYSTISQLGIMVALVGVGTSAALEAAVLLVAAHALFKATLFMLVGIIDREAGSRDIRELSGLWRVMPVTAALTGLAAMSMAGLPPLVGFVAKEEALYAFLNTSDASWTSGAEWTGIAAAAITVVGAALTFAYSARIIAGAFAGPLTQTSLYEPSALFLLPAAVPAVLGLVLGVAPGLLNGIISRATTDAGFTQVPEGLSLWHGFTIALGLSAMAITLGVIVHTQRPRLARFFDRRPPRPLAIMAFDSGWDAALRFGAWVGRPAHRTTPGIHLAGIAILMVALGAWAIVELAGNDLAGTRSGAVQPLDIVILVVLLPAIAALALVTRALAALVLAGIVGLTIAVWLLLLGAPDVALTLLLVEILTVVVAAPVLAGLPRQRVLPRGRTTAVIGAVIVAVFAGGITWALTGRRERSDLAEYFLTQAEAETGGTNVVNTILVDFRGLDTLGEITVLGAAALGLLAAGTALVRQRTTVLGPGERSVLRVGSVVVLPLLLLVAVVLFWRGHDEPGGGFIAGLVAGAALAVARIARIPVRLPSVPALIAAGLGLAVGIGLVGILVAGAFLEPFPMSLPGNPGYLTSSLVFDLGVFLIVIGLVRAALDRLGGVPAEREEMAA